MHAYIHPFRQAGRQADRHVHICTSILYMHISVYSYMKSLHLQLRTLTFASISIPIAT